MRLFEGTEFDRPPRCERCDELEENWFFAEACGYWCHPVSRCRV